MESLEKNDSNQYLDVDKPLINSFSINNEDELNYFLVVILFELDQDKFDPETLYDSDSSYRIMYDLLKDKCPLQILVEDYYVDRVYRDSFYLYFASKYKQYSRFCKRLFLFKESFGDKEFYDYTDKELQKIFMGTIVIRPLNQGRIGRSLLNPRFFTPENSCIRCARYKVVLGGIELNIDAFPFSMQDSETTSCAEITIINMLDYFSKRYQNYSCALPSDIFRIIDRHGFERTLPTKGLRYSEISRVFSEMGFYPRLYFSETAKEKLRFKSNMHYYVESGIPVEIGLKRVEENDLHAITCIGHVKANVDEAYIKNNAKIKCISNKYSSNDGLCVIDTADLISDYIFMNDGQTPYKIYTWNTTDTYNQGDCVSDEKTNSSMPLPSKISVFGSEFEPRNIMVPLYKRMFLEAEDAFDIFTNNLIDDEVGISWFISQKDDFKSLGTENNPLIVRVFLASSRHFRQARVADMEKTSKASELYLNVPLPKFVWVCELFTAEGYCKDHPEAIGELVLDATSSKNDVNSVIIRHYFNYISVCDYEDSSMLFDKSVKERFNEEGGPVFFLMDKWRPIKAYDHNLHMPELS